jgi:hypothetical protein
MRTKACVKDTNKVFHGFGHRFQDALRHATPDEELRDAIQGRSNQSVSRGYGAKCMLERWRIEVLKVVIDNVSYPGLDLSRVKPCGIRIAWPVSFSPLARKLARAGDPTGVLRPRRP